MSTSSASDRWRAALWWIAALAWMAVIFWLSSQPDSDPSARRFSIGVYKLAHLIVFSILGVLVAGGTRHLNTSRAAWWGWVIVVLYAISDEIHQSFVPGRTPLVTDVAIDSLGGVLGIIGYAMPGNIREGGVRSLAMLVGRRPPAADAELIDTEGSLDNAG